LYYTVELLDGRIFQFPINTTEPTYFEGTRTNFAGGEDIRFKHEDGIQLSSDLGNTSFNAEIKASELNRWIAKAYDKGEFICINKAPEMVEETFDEQSNLAGTV